MKYIRIVLIAALMLVLLCAAAFAEEIIASGSCGSKVSWELQADGSLYITGKGAMTDYNATDNLAPWKSYADQIKSVEFSDGITNVGDYTFNNCTSITSAYLPEGITRIGSAAFYKCSLAEINIPDTVTYVGLLSFAYNDIETLYYPGSITSYNGSIFEYCENLRSATIGEGITRLSTSMFEGCTSLTEVHLPGTLQHIRDRAFWHCALTEINLPDSLTKIGEWAFNSCQLTSFKGPKNLTEIGNYAFYGNVLSEIELPLSLVTLGSAAFAENYDPWASNVIDTLVIPASLKVVSESAFKGTYFRKIIIEEDVTTLSAGCFANGSTYKKENTQIEVPASVTEIGDNWYGGGDIIYTPNGSTYVYQWATERSRHVVRLDAPFRFYNTNGEIHIFNYNGRDSEVTIPETIDGNPVTLLMPLMFNSNPLYGKDPFVTKVTLPNSSKLLVQNSSLSNLTEGCEVHIPAGINQFEPGCLSGDHIIYTTTNSPAHKHWKAGDEAVALVLTDKTDSPYTYTKNGSTCTITGYYSAEKDIVIPSEIDGYKVTAIGSYAFRGTVVREVTIPDTVTKIGEMAFYDVAKPEKLFVRLPNGVSSFGKDPFPRKSGTTLMMINNSTTHKNLKSSYKKQILLWDGKDFSYVTFNTERDGKTVTFALINGYWGNSTGDIVVPTKIGGYHVDGIGGISDVAEWEVVFPADRPFNSLKIPEGMEQVAIVIEPIATKRVYLPKNQFFTAMINADKSTIFYVYPDSPWHEYLQDVYYTNFRFLGNQAGIQLPSAIKTIAAEAFMDNTSVQYLEIPANLEAIGANAFRSCKNLQKVCFDGLNTIIADGAFDGCHAELIFECFAGSTAEAYAKAHNIKCELIS